MSVTTYVTVFVGRRVWGGVRRKGWGGVGGGCVKLESRQLHHVPLTVSDECSPDSAPPQKKLHLERSVFQPSQRGGGR